MAFATTATTGTTAGSPARPEEERQPSSSTSDDRNLARPRASPGGPQSHQDPTDSGFVVTRRVPGRWRSVVCPATGTAASGPVMSARSSRNSSPPATRPTQGPGVSALFGDAAVRARVADALTTDTDTVLYTQSSTQVPGQATLDNEQWDFPWSGQPGQTVHEAVRLRWTALFSDAGASVSPPLPRISPGAHHRAFRSALSAMSPHSTLTWTSQTEPGSPPNRPAWLSRPALTPMSHSSTRRRATSCPTSRRS